MHVSRKFRDEPEKFILRQIIDSKHIISNDIVKVNTFILSVDGAVWIKQS